METVKHYWNTLQPNRMQQFAEMPENSITYSSKSQETAPTIGTIQEAIRPENNSEPQPDIQEMAQKFSLWFYQILASISNFTYDSNSIAEHFWGDSWFKATLCQPGHVETRNAQGSEEVTNVTIYICTYLQVI